ncbi:MAG: hypothetical protein IPM99_07270 [Rubrivivax sp.]|nr:hypothetical protein [Rubrivivax sp.]
MTKTLAAPPTRSWYPESVYELAAAGWSPCPSGRWTSDYRARRATVADYAEALSASPLWQAVERRFPGVQALAAEHMGAASPQGAEAVQTAGHEVVAALLPPLLAQASPETRWLFTEVLLAQMNVLATIDAELCRNLLLGDPPRTAACRPGWPGARPNGCWGLGERRAARRRGGRTRWSWRSSAAPWASVHPAPGDLVRPTVMPPANEPDCDRGRAMPTELATLAAPQRRAWPCA